ncbi:MAG: cellulase family glycosylhydrolase [Phycisphaerae bacterium]|nr:cellulase family glycosylhydrolase [Phycisphaerae bacterium]
MEMYGKTILAAFISILMFISIALAQPARAVPLPEPTAEKLPGYRGFNLLNKFHKDWNNSPFLEEDFKLIAELGFNFVRLPMDYRCWIKDNDWTSFNEEVLAQIDQAVNWGIKYNIHVCLNFHRCPGYTVANPKEKTSLWTDPETQRICALHWATFARRYKHIPNKNLSFNLTAIPYEVGLKLNISK